MPTPENLSRRPAGASQDGRADTPPAGTPERLAAPPCWPSHDLLGQGIEALIRHGDALYRLRLTRQGKLILTK